MESREESLDHLLTAAAAVCDVAAVAKRNRKPLQGAGFYATRFHGAVIELAKAERRGLEVLRLLNGVDVSAVEGLIGVIKSETSGWREREEAQKRLRFVVEAEGKPRLPEVDRPVVPGGEPVLPMSILQKAPSYLQRILLQANGCYIQRWNDACAVMVRKLVESLIIEVYEKHGKADEIKKDGEYLMLSGLVTKMLSQTHWALSRETRKELPELKKLGDRSAHARHYQCTREDIDRVLSGLRTTVDNLLHHAGLA